jgi:hypothetical protein
MSHFRTRMVALPPRCCGQPEVTSPPTYRDDYGVAAIIGPFKGPPVLRLIGYQAQRGPPKSPHRLQVTRLVFRHVPRPG